MKVKLCLIKKLQNATDMSLPKKHSFWPINEDLTQKLQHILTLKDFIGNLQNLNSLLKLKIIISVVQTRGERFSIYKILKFSMLTVWHLIIEFNLKMSTPLAIFDEAFFKRIQDLFLQPNVKRLDIVFDRYDDIFIKYGARNKKFKTL